MHHVDQAIFVTSLLLLLGIASSKFSARLGMPVLVLFLAIGMLAGSEGLGGIDFEDYALAHAIGTLALAVILFDGGLSTPMSAVRAVWKPSLYLATGGVLITALVTGYAASWILGIPPLEGMLLGSVVASTDATAVFSVLRSGGVSLPRHITSLLEIESGANDPMGIFLTIGLVEVVLGHMPLGIGLLTLFIKQMSLGIVVGLAIGYATVRVVNRINLAAAGLYPTLVSTFGLLAYGLAASLGGSGFLAVYLAGIVIGNNRIVFQRGIFLFHDAGAWLAQIIMFVVLGLLSFPSRLWDVAGKGLLIAVVLMFIARPLAILPLLPFQKKPRELLFLSWVGLKGAVPITLATFPLLLGVPGAALLFDVVFFVVVVSAVVQGCTIPFVARRLGLEVPAEKPAPVSLEISSLRHVDGDIVEFTVNQNSLAAGRLVRDLALPEAVVIALIARGQKIVPPRGSTRIEPGDHVILVLCPDARPLVNRVFANTRTTDDEIPRSLEFPLRGSITVGELEEFYGLHLDAPAGNTLSEMMLKRVGKKNAVPGALANFGQIALRVRELTSDGAIDSLGMVILPEQPAEAKPADTGTVPKQNK